MPHITAYVTLLLFPPHPTPTPLTLQVIDFNAREVRNKISIGTGECTHSVYCRYSTQYRYPLYPTDAAFAGAHRCCQQSQTEHQQL